MIKNGGESESNSIIFKEFLMKKNVNILDYNLIISNHISSIRKSTKGGYSFRAHLNELAFSMLTEYYKFNSYILPDFILDVPRGGTPMSKGCKRFYNSIPIIQANSGANCNPLLPLIPAELPIVNNGIIIVDSIIASGKTLINILDELCIKISVPITILSAIATPLGIDAILAKYPDVYIISGTLEPECNWVTIKNKKVLFVSNVGDIGELVSAN